MSVTNLEGFTLDDLSKLLAEGVEKHLARTVSNILFDMKKDELHKAIEDKVQEVLSRFCEHKITMHRDFYKDRILINVTFAEPKP